jgi:hypothetical protein
MLKLYQEADLYLNCPRLDCFPSSILDAFATVVAVVTTNAAVSGTSSSTAARGGWSSAATARGSLGALTFLRDPALARGMAAAGRAELSGAT